MPTEVVTKTANMPVGVGPTVQVTVVAVVPVFERTPETGHKGRVLVQPGAVGEPIVMTPWR